MGDRARDDKNEVTLPMAPSEAEWARMTALDRLRVAASLPADLGLLPSEGTPHSNAIRRVHNVLDDHFSRRGRAVFIAENLAEAEAKLAEALAEIERLRGQST